jgi:glutathione S-transferase
MTEIPILYSFRRCPYAIRARMGLAYAGVTCELREVDLKQKPAAMLSISPKGTTPVLQLPNGSVLEESLDIMNWAIEQRDPEGWDDIDRASLEQGKELITANDVKFKPYLDRYKYAARFPDLTKEEHRSNAEIFLQTLEALLSEHQFLLCDRITIFDIAIFPFVRQFAYVDWDWFQQSAYNHLQRWLSWHENSVLFLHIMPKIPVWSPEQPITLISGV